MDVFGIYWVFNNFLDAEGGVSGGVEIDRFIVEDTLHISPLVDFINLNKKGGYGGGLMLFGDLDNSTEGGDDVDVDASEVRREVPVGAVGVFK